VITVAGRAPEHRISPPPSLDEYLTRLGYTGPLEPSLTCLEALCSAHLLAVPYEMIDSLRGRRPRLTHRDVFDKVVRRRGGGTCLEATPLFGHFLREIGFTVRLVAAQAWRINGGWAPRWDHLLLVVEADGASWVVDVSFLMLTVLRPLRIADTPQEQSGWTYRVGGSEGHSVVLRRNREGDWGPVYRFARKPLEIPDYEWIVDYHMTADDSPLTGRLLRSRAVPDGKLIVMRQNYVRAEHGRESMEFLATTADAEKALREVFHGHEHLLEDAVRLWERTRNNRRGPLPGIG